MRKLLALALVVLAACGVDRSRQCASSDDCEKRHLTQMGVCISSPSSDSSWCAYPDQECVSALRWGPLAGDSLLGDCVEITDSPLWAAVGGGDVDDVAFGAGTDVQGSKFALAGSFSGELHFPGCNQLSSQVGSKDIFVAVFNPDGGCRWAARYGGSGNDTVTVLSMDSVSLVVAGTFEESISFGGDEFVVPPGFRDVFVASFAAADGNHQGSNALGCAEGNCTVNGLARFGGDYVLVGTFISINFDGTTYYANGGYDMYVAAYAGTLLTYRWSRIFGEFGDDRAAAVAVDASGNVFVTGQFGGTVNFGDGPVDSAAGSTDIFVLKLDNDGATSWSRRFGGSGGDYGLAIAADPQGGAVVGGSMSSAIDFGSGTAFTPSWDDGFILRLSSSGEYVWAVQVPGTWYESVRALAVNPTSVFAAGKFQDIITLGGDPLVSRGMDDAFAVKLDLTTGAFQDQVQIGGPGVECANAIAVDNDGSFFIAGSFQESVPFAGGAPVISNGMSDFFGVLYPQ